MFSEDSPEWYPSVDQKPFSNKFDYDDDEAKRNQIQNFEKDINQMESMISSMEAMSKNIRAHLFEMQPPSSEGLIYRSKPYDGVGSCPSDVTSPDFSDVDYTACSEVSCISSSEDANYNDYNTLKAETRREAKCQSHPPPSVGSTFQPDLNKEPYQIPARYKNPAEPYQEKLGKDTTLLAVSDDGLQQTHHPEEMTTHSTNNLSSPVLHRQTIKLEDLVNQAAKLLEDDATKPNIDTDALEAGKKVKVTTVLVNRLQDAGQKTTEKDAGGIKRQQNSGRKKSELFVSGNKRNKEEQEEQCEDQDTGGDQDTDGDRDTSGDQDTGGMRSGQDASWCMQKRDRKNCVAEQSGGRVPRLQGLSWPREKADDVYGKRKRTKDVSENRNEQDMFRSSCRQHQGTTRRVQHNPLVGGKLQGGARRKSHQFDEYPGATWQCNGMNMDAAGQTSDAFSFQSYDGTFPIEWEYSDDPDEEILLQRRDRSYDNVFSPDSFVNKRISYSKEPNIEKAFVKGSSNALHRQNSKTNLRRHIKSCSTDDISKIYDNNYNRMSVKGGHNVNSQQLFSDSDEYQEFNWSKEKERRRTLSLTNENPKNKSRGVHFSDTVYMIDDLSDRIPLNQQKDYLQHGYRQPHTYESIYPSSYTDPYTIRPHLQNFSNNPEHIYLCDRELDQPYFDYSPWTRKSSQSAKQWNVVPFSTSSASRVGQPQNAPTSRKAGTPILKKKPQKGPESLFLGSKAVDKFNSSLPKTTKEAGFFLHTDYSLDSGYLSDTPKMLGCMKQFPHSNNTNEKNKSEAKKNASNVSPKLEMLCCVMSMSVKDPHKNAGNNNNKEAIYICNDLKNTYPKQGGLPCQEKLGIPVKSSEGKKIAYLVRELLQHVSSYEMINGKRTTTDKSAPAFYSDLGPPVLYCYLPSDVPASNKGESSTNWAKQNRNSNRNAEKSSAKTPGAKGTQTDNQDLACYYKNIERNGGLSWWISGQDSLNNNSSKTERIYRNTLPPPMAVSKSKPACFNNNNKHDNGWLFLNQQLKATRKGKVSPFPTKKNVPMPLPPKKKPFLL